MCDRNSQLWSVVHSHTNVLILISARFVNKTLLRTKMIILTWSRKYPHPQFLWLHLPPLWCSSTWHVLQIDPLGRWGNLNSFCFSVFSLTLRVCMQFIGKIESALKSSTPTGLAWYHIISCQHIIVLKHLCDCCYLMWKCCISGTWHTGFHWPEPLGFPQFFFEHSLVISSLSEQQPQSMVWMWAEWKSVQLTVTEDLWKEMIKLKWWFCCDDKSVNCLINWSCT